jgi:hypothetical protein
LLRAIPPAPVVVVKLPPKADDQTVMMFVRGLEILADVV